MPTLPDSLADAPVRLVQLTDSHLFAGADGALLGLCTQDSLDHVVDRVLAEQPHIDLVVATGDLSQDGSVASYQRFRQISARLPAPARWIPGNHDELPALRQVCEGSELLEPVVDLGQWRIVLLDSAIPGAVPGRLAAAQLDILDRALREAPERHHLICFHHHPVPIGCAWLDPIGLLNADELFAVVDRHPQVRALLWGHVHQEYDQCRNGVRLLATPSTCVQFEPRSVDFQAGRQAPGYRWLHLHADGRLDTGVSRVTDIDFAQDFSATGY